MPRRVVLVLVLFAVAATPRARSVRLFELATRCDLVVHGTVLEVGDTTATIDVTNAYKRDLDARRIIVTPNTYRGCGCSVINFAVGEEVVVFLATLPDGRFEAIVGGQGKVAIADNVPVAQVVEASARLVDVAKLDEDPRNRAMIGLATSDNPTLRSEARAHIGGMRGSDLQRYRADLVRLLEGRLPETRSAGLCGLRYMDAPEALDRMVALTNDPDPDVLQAASDAIRSYDTAESVAALSRLTGHTDRNVRIRAINNLAESGRTEALETLLGLLDDPDPEEREYACTGLVGWLRRGREAAFAARLAILHYDDAPAWARREASKTAREGKSPALVEPLVRVLQAAKPGGPVEAASLESLRQIHRYGGDAGTRGVETHLDLVRGALHRGTGGTAPVEILAAAKEMEEVRWAASAHPDPVVRGLAQILVARH